MNYKAKEEYRLLIQPRYQRANKTVKQRILDEFCAVCGYHHKYAITLLKKPVRVKRGIYKTPGPKPRYQDADFLKVLQRIWYETDLFCAKRLKAAIPLWLPKYGQHYGDLSEEIQHKLLTINSASIDRVLKPLRDRIEIKKRSQTKPGTLLKHKIPYKLDVPWNSSLPGFVEADTVTHCGENMSGNHAWSLT